MSGYCPAGKCECENKITLLYGSGVLIDACKLNQRLTEGSLKLYDVCPWPSRQVRVEPQGDCDKCPKDDAYAAGRLAGLREAREGVEQLAETHPDINVSADNGWVKLSVILAAIDAVKGE